MLDVVAKYQTFGIDLEPSGDKFRAPCPFHSETKPSFFVYGDGSYHCFGCGAHGNVSSFEQNSKDQKFITDPGLVPCSDILNFKHLKKMVEADLYIALEDKSFKLRCESYDIFDRLIIDIYFMLSDFSNNSIDVAVEFKRRFKLLQNKIKLSS